MGSKTFSGVWFTTYAHDHLPPHVHGYYAETCVVVDLLTDRTVRQSERHHAVSLGNAKRSDVRHILDSAAENAAELMQLWEAMHGSAS